MEAITTEERATLNEHQKRHLRTSCQYVDKILFDVEAVLNSASSGSPFEKYRDDLTPAQAKVTRDYIARIRAQIVRVLEGQDVELSKDRISARHAIHTALEFIDIALEEMKPKYMRGYGELPSSVVPESKDISRTGWPGWLKRTFHGWRHSGRIASTPRSP